jgi:hypothetical protein
LIQLAATPGLEERQRSQNADGNSVSQIGPEKTSEVQYVEHRNQRQTYYGQQVAALGAGRRQFPGVLQIFRGRKRVHADRKANSSRSG